MKIGLVCPYDIMGAGGVQEVVRASYEGLTARGHKVRIISPRPRRYKGKEPKDHIFIGQSANFKSIFKTTGQISAAVDTEAIDTMLGKEKFDVLHFHEPWVPLVSRQILMRSKSKNVATFHAKLPDTFVTKSIERTITPYIKPMLEYFNALTAVSEPAAVWTRSLSSIPIQIIPNGIDLSKYKTNGYKPLESPRTILYVGRLEKRKGVHYLIKAFAELQKKRHDIRLIIAGNGASRRTLEEYVTENNIKNISFPGFVDEETKLRLMHEATLFCSPALYGESFGIVLLEAMACGLVTVAGDNPGYMSVLQDTGSMSLVDPKDTDKFVNLLNLLIDDEKLRTAWKKWAKDNVGQYEYSKIVDQYEALYKKVAAGK